MKKIISSLLIVTLLLVSAATLSSCGGNYCYAKMTVKDFGTVIIRLDKDAAPITVDNFVMLANEGFYDGLTFHRIIKNFMIQGGDPDGNGRGGSDTPITGEFALNGYDNPLSHTRGTISMARTNDPDSATSQFFICNADALHLDGSYAAFGKVIEGMDVIDAITEYGVQYAFNGMIYIKEYQPVIESIEIYDKRP